MKTAFHPRGLFSSKITGCVSRVFNPSSVPCPSRFTWGWPVERPPYHHAEVTRGKMWARVDDSAVQLHLKEEASVDILQFERGVKEVKCPLWSTITERDWLLRTSALRTRQAFISSGDLNSSGLRVYLGWPYPQWLRTYRRIYIVYHFVIFHLCKYEKE